MMASKLSSSLLTLSEAADLLDIPRQKLRVDLANGTTDVPAFKLGREWRVNPHQLCRWMDQQNVDWNEEQMNFLKRVEGVAK